jgi:hypothetical protein
MHRELTGVNSSGEPARMRQMPGRILVHGCGAICGSRLVFCDSTSVCATRGKAAVTALHAIPFTKDRRLNSVSLAKVISINSLS